MYGFGSVTVFRDSEMGKGTQVDYDAELLERVSRRFRRGMWESVASDVVGCAGIELESFGPVLATAFGELADCRRLNEIQGAAEPGAVADGHLAAAVEWMQSREVDYCVPIAAGRPGAEEAEAWLGERGYERGSGWVKFVRDASPPSFQPSPAITVWPLGDQEIDGGTMSEIAAEAMDVVPMMASTLFYGLPDRAHWHCYTTAMEGVFGIVSATSMLIHDGVAQLGPTSTLPRARRRGCATALLSQCLADAHLAGCHTVLTEIWDCEPGRLSPAARILERAGFEPAYAVSDWQLPALHPAAFAPSGYW